MSASYSPQKMAHLLGAKLDEVLEALFETGNRTPVKPARDGKPPEFRAAAFTAVQKHLGRFPTIYGVSELPKLETISKPNNALIKGV